MHHAFTRVQSTQKAKTRQRTRRTALSLFIGGLFCSAAPAWADCSVSNPQNAKGGVDMTCVGVDISQNTSLLGNSHQNNNVTVEGKGTTVTGNVYGGVIHSNGFVVAGNTVTLDNSSVTGTVFGGNSGLNDAGSVTGNIVTLNDSSVGGDVIGGFMYSKAPVTGNTVTLNGSSRVNNSVHGGMSYEGAATGNMVTLNDSSVGGDVYGGYNFYGWYISGSGPAVVTHNIVNINDTAKNRGII